MPMSTAFKQRLTPVLKDIVQTFRTPFHIYDETGMVQTCEELNQVFSDISGFREYFAVKALPNPFVMDILKSRGFGFDCSSIPEIALARKVGSSGDDIMFTSNNTSQAQFQTALDQEGCIINLMSGFYEHGLKSLLNLSGLPSD